jgi:hypothetical protein
MKPYEGSPVRAGSGCWSLEGCGGFFYFTWYTGFAQDRCASSRGIRHSDGESAVGSHRMVPIRFSPLSRGGSRGRTSVFIDFLSVYCRRTKIGAETFLALILGRDYWIC